MTLTEIGERINAHLERFEADPAINAPVKYGSVELPKYYRASAGRAGNRVYIRYVSFQHTSHLTRDEALRYLEMLDAGFVGRHWDALREAAKEPR